MFTIKTYLNDGRLLATHTISMWYEVQFQLYGVFNRNPNLQRYELYRDGELIHKESRP